MMNKLIINKLSNKLAYDDQFFYMSKHNGRLKILLKDILNKDEDIPIEIKDKVLNNFSETIIKRAKDIFLDEILYIKNFYNTYQEKKFNVWGGQFSLDELLLLRGFIITSAGNLDWKIHRSQDYKYYNFCKNNPNELVKFISENRSFGGMSGPNDFLDSEITNFDKCPIPLEFLDTPIALMCKLLPMFKINTLFSCGGHLENKSSPEISFRTLDDFHRAQILFEELESKFFSQNNFKITFNYEPKNWMGKKLIFQMNNFETQDYHSTYLEIFEIDKLFLSKYQKSNSP